MDKRTKKSIREAIKDGSIYRKKRYIQWRSRVFKRDQYTCQMPECKKKGGMVQAHHIKMKYYFPELIYNVTNGITLCQPCHQRIHEEKLDKKLVRKFRKIVRENMTKQRKRRSNAKNK